MVYHAARTYIRPRFLNESFLGVGDGLVIERSVIERNQSRMALFHRAAAGTVVGHAYTFGPTVAKVKRPRKTAANHRTPRGVLRKSRNGVIAFPDYEAPVRKTRSGTVRRFTTTARPAPAIAKKVVKATRSRTKRPSAAHF